MPEEDVQEPEESEVDKASDLDSRLVVEGLLFSSDISGERYRVT